MIFRKTDIILWLGILSVFISISVFLGCCEILDDCDEDETISTPTPTPTITPPETPTPENTAEPTPEPTPESTQTPVLPWTYLGNSFKNNGEWIGSFEMTVFPDGNITGSIVLWLWCETTTGYREMTIQHDFNSQLMYGEIFNYEYEWYDSAGFTQYWISYTLTGTVFETHADGSWEAHNRETGHFYENNCDGSGYWTGQRTN